MSFDADISELTHTFIGSCRLKSIMAATAESCTAGLLASCITEISGASDIYYGGFVTYANAAKETMLGVSPEIVESHGAVSLETANAMLDGLFCNTPAHFGIAITGIAGPNSDASKKPVGLVVIATGTRENRHTLKYEFGNLGRDHVREESIRAALTQALTHF